MIHGGDIYRNRVKIDFSISINPLGVPEKVQEAMREAVGVCSRYPDIHSEALRHSIGAMTGVDKKNIICGNGASELFLAIIRAINPKKVLLPIPSFSGYEYAAKAVKSTVQYFMMKEQDGFCLKEDFTSALDSGIDLIFLANPNNPVGNLIDDRLLKRILNICLEREIIVVVDECFIEFTGEEGRYSLKNYLEEYPNLIVVRAFTKLYAIPGVRLGYLFCHNNKLLSDIKQQLPEWNVSSFAGAAGIAACREVEYKNKTVEFVKKERAYLMEHIVDEGILVFPSDANYILLQTKLQLYEELLEREILIRDCSNFAGLKKGFYRIAVKNRAENKELIQAMKEIRANG